MISENLFVAEKMFDGTIVPCLRYSFKNSENKLQTFSIETINDKSYVRALAFRQELYKIRGILYDLVTDVFDDHQKDDGFKDWWEYINDRYNLKGQSSELDGKYKNTDPSNLLTLIVYHDYFFRNPDFRWIRALAKIVNLLRHRYYGHLPRLLLNIGSELFGAQLQAIDDLDSLIREYLGKWRYIPSEKVGKERLKSAVTILEEYEDDAVDLIPAYISILRRVAKDFPDLITHKAFKKLDSLIQTKINNLQKETSPVLRELGKDFAKDFTMLQEIPEYSAVRTSTMLQTLSISAKKKKIDSSTEYSSEEEEAEKK